ncbi:PREDICTED: uncharacterized protein LOC104784194 isoform X1 [Camelina sativa]|uniref:Uncharacterized protein LOC104784194 isoform X1 n=2 Tax=Camelina sativa TaxID=90675 RepID=A0ABM0YXQ0_CAMSA|nr:PREDICTED: uncharacterized protein LOC104784194 isoform X1 [Camelina sativa]
MASSSNSIKYPPLLYEEGKSPLQHRSMNHNCFVSKIGILREGLGVDVWDKLKDSSLGVFIKFAELEYTWAAQRVHFLLTHQLRINNIHEVWSLIDNRPIRFSLNEFAEITRLNCDAFDLLENFDVDHHDFWKEMKIPTTLDGPMWSELVKVIDSSKTWHLDKRMMVGRLCLLSVCVHGIHHTSRIPLATAKRVLDPVAFEKHPWGRVAFSSLVNSVKMVDYDRDSYTIHGCVHALLIWLYESVTGIGESYGVRRIETTGVPLLDWRSSRKRINFTNFIQNEKKLHGQVRVRHMVHVSEENMYPLWSDTDEHTDLHLDELLKDLIHNRLSLDAWSCVKTVGISSKKKKRSAEADKVNDNRGCNPKKKRLTDSDPKCEQGENVTNMEDGKDDKSISLDIWRAIEKMNETISDLGKTLNSRIDALESKFETFVEKKMTVFKEEMGERIKALEKERKEPKDADVRNDATSHTINDDEGTSKTPSWIVEMKQTSQDEFPVQRVVRKESVKVGKKETSKKKKITGLASDDVEDITTQVQKAKLKIASSSEDTWSNKEDQLVHKKLEVTLNRLGEALTKLDGPGPSKTSRRVPQLAGSQKYPYLGNSTVKRIITEGDNVLGDHLKPVDDEKHQRLLDFLSLDKEEPLSTSNAAVRFYWKIMTPRKHWPSYDYGWLTEHHMGCAMAMFRRRYMREPCPYPKERIAFLDQDLMTTLKKDYIQFDMGPKNFVFRDSYVKHVFGEYPEESATNKKWWIDVDNLYACLFVNGNHWVALDIDLRGKKIHIYDSIPTLVNDEQMAIACLPLRRMIPAMLSDMIPETNRKKSRAMLELRRVKKNVPRNENPGDCGVYALKYIECLALGKTFDGLCDENMLALRIKLAAELYDEVRELAIPPNMTDSPPRAVIIPSLVDESL